jgi:hypothetical protein
VLPSSLSSAGSPLCSGPSTGADIMGSPKK